MKGMNEPAALSISGEIPVIQRPSRPRWRPRLPAHLRTVTLNLATLGLLATSTLAQEATPTPDRFAFAERRLIDPRECVVMPLPAQTVAQVLHLKSDGVPKPAFPVVPSPLGQVADNSDRTGIKSAVRELIACFNAQDMRRAMALMTEHGIQCLYWAGTVDQPARTALQGHLEASPNARTPNLAIRLIVVTDVSLMADGREAAFITINDPSRPPSGPETVFVIFSRHADAWLLDDWVAFSFVPVTASEGPPEP
jgi:hypothetical protein